MVSSSAMETYPPPVKSFNGEVYHTSLVVSSLVDLSHDVLYNLFNEGLHPLNLFMLVRIECHLVLELLPLLTTLTTSLSLTFLCLLVPLHHHVYIPLLVGVYGVLLGEEVWALAKLVDFGRPIVFLEDILHVKE